MQFFMVKAGKNNVCYRVYGERFSVLFWPWSAGSPSVIVQMGSPMAMVLNLLGIPCSHGSPVLRVTCLGVWSGVCVH